MDQNIFRFYSDSKDGVTYNKKVTPLLTKLECRQRRCFSNFYRNPGFSFEYNGITWLDSEVPFQYYRWHRDVPGETADVRAARLEFAEHIRTALTPAKCYFLQSFVKYRKSDGSAYSSAPFPGFKPYADLVMAAYNRGVRRPNFDGNADYQLMLELNEAKYLQNTNLMAQLKATGTSTVVEHTARDRRWGDGGDGSGTNWLGQVLMHVRDNN